MMQSMKCVFFASLWVALLSSFSLAKDLQISVKPIKSFIAHNPEQVTFGKLEFLGGMELISKNKDFGGVSGLRLDATGDILFAVTDQGHFLKADLKRDSFNRITALKNADISRLRNRKGKKFKGKRNADAESLATSGCQFIAGFERNHRVEFFNLKNSKLYADKRAKPLSFAQAGFPNNKGLEAIAVSPVSGELLVFAEYAPDEDNHHQGFIIKDGKTSPLAVTLTSGYSLTDADFLPNGDLLILERFYTPITGAAMRIRRFDADELKPGTVLSGKIIMQATSEMEIDNMEGLAITQSQDGSTILTLVSDDNFSRNQRTLLLEFRLLQ